MVAWEISTEEAAKRLSVKARIRSRYKRLRAAIPEDEHRRLGALVEERVLREPALLAARTVYCYEAFGREVPTAAVVHALLERGTRVIVPPADRHAHPLSDAQELRAGPGYDPEQPAVSVGLGAGFDVRSVDVFVVPGIAWDLRGYRIGYGGGFFDRLLAAARPDAVRIGLAFELQLTPSLPADDWDIPVDLIVTEERTIRVAWSR